ncbi:MAG: alpha-amylase family glycosyl hydrolase [Candidatus Nanohaloarchaea archaeon]
MGTEWFDNSVIYQVFIDRFAGFESTEGWHNPEFIGGDIKGVREKLDYLDNLGIDVIWLSPFYETSAYHGYHVTDYYSVDSRFGTEEELEKLIDEAKNRDIRVIADFVPNHCSREHPYFQEALKSRASKYRDWFYFEENGASPPEDDYLTFLSFDELPKLNMNHEPVREHIKGAAKKWLELGLDGYRLDHVIGIEHEFWREFSNEMKEEHPDSILIGEAWMKGITYSELETLRVSGKRLKWLLGSASPHILKEYTDVLDGVLDFRFQELVRQHIAKDSIWKPRKLLETRLKLHYLRFPEDYNLPTFLDNHDMNRFLYQTGNRREKLKDAARLQFEQDQPAVIYYGTESGLSQSHGIEEFDAHGDLQARKPMPWDDMDEELVEFFRKLIKEKGSQTGA